MLPSLPPPQKKMVLSNEEDLTIDAGMMHYGKEYVHLFSFPAVPELLNGAIHIWYFQQIGMAHLSPIEVGPQPHHVWG